MHFTLYKHSKPKILAHGAVVFYTTVLTLGREKESFLANLFRKKGGGVRFDFKLLLPINIVLWIAIK